MSIVRSWYISELPFISIETLMQIEPSLNVRDRRSVVQ